MQDDEEPATEMSTSLASSGWQQTVLVDLHKSVRSRAESIESTMIFFQCMSTGTVNLNFSLILLKMVTLSSVQRDRSAPELQGYGLNREDKGLIDISYCIVTDMSSEFFELFLY